MNEKPILFSGEMVRAILSGRKTETRRLLKTQPAASQRFVGLRDHLNYPASRGSLWAGFDNKPDHDLDPVFFRCPYGAPGDRLWVRETFLSLMKGSARYRADNDRPEWSGLWKPSIHMPRWASRINLMVEGVRVERLQDITEEGARREGAPYYVPGHGPVSDIEVYCDGGFHGAGSYRYGFEDLWDSINGKRAPWASNPWVWVVSFKVEVPHA